MFQTTNLINPNSWISFFYPQRCRMHLPPLSFFLLEIYIPISSTFQTNLPTNRIPSTSHRLRPALAFTVKLLDKSVYINHPHFSPQIHSLMICNLASLSWNFIKTVLSKDTNSFQITQVNSIHSVIILIRPLFSFKWHCELPTSTPFL